MHLLQLIFLSFLKLKIALKLFDKVDCDNWIPSFAVINFRKVKLPVASRPRGYVLSLQNENCIITDNMQQNSSRIVSLLVLFLIFVEKKKSHNLTSFDTDKRKCHWCLHLLISLQCYDMFVILVVVVSRLENIQAPIPFIYCRFLQWNPFYFCISMPLCVLLWSAFYDNDCFEKLLTMFVFNFVFNRHLRWLKWTLMQAEIFLDLVSSAVVLSSFVLFYWLCRTLARPDTSVHLSNFIQFPWSHFPTFTLSWYRNNSKNPFFGDRQ